MEPEIVQREAFTVVGLKYRGKNENSEIPQLWRALMPRTGEIQHIAEHHVAYGINDNMDESTGEWDYVAGFAVHSAEKIPPGMVRCEVPRGTYAIFSCTLPTVGETYMHAYRTWVPQSGYQLAGGPDFELYDEAFNPEDPESKMYIYVPIK